MTIVSYLSSHLYSYKIFIPLSRCPVTEYFVSALPRHPTFPQAHFREPRLCISAISRMAPMQAPYCQTSFLNTVRDSTGNVQISRAQVGIVTLDETRPSKQFRPTPRESMWIEAGLMESCSKSTALLTLQLNPLVHDKSSYKSRLTWTGEPYFAFVKQESTVLKKSAHFGEHFRCDWPG